MNYPLNELIDKASIIKLKSERIPEEAKGLEKELKKLMRAIRSYRGDQVKVQKWLKELYDINSAIWSLEAQIRKGDIGDISLEEVGKTAIEIRKNNKIRVSIKNKIVEMTGSGYKDIKINHVSE